MIEEPALWDGLDVGVISYLILHRSFIISSLFHCCALERVCPVDVKDEDDLIIQDLVWVRDIINLSLKQMLKSFTVTTVAGFLVRLCTSTMPSTRGYLQTWRVASSRFHRILVIHTCSLKLLILCQLDEEMDQCGLVLTWQYCSIKCKQCPWRQCDFIVLDGTFLIDVSVWTG